MLKIEESLRRRAQGGSSGKGRAWFKTVKLNGKLWIVKLGIIVS